MDGMENERTGGGRREIQRNAYLVAQEGLVSSLMMLPPEVREVSSMIEDKDFSNVSCRYIYHAMYRLMNSGELPDDPDAFLGAIQAELESEGKLVAVGGQQKLVSLFEAGVINASRATVQTYARSVKDISAKSEMSSLIKEIDPALRPDSGRTARRILEDTSHRMSEIMGGLENVKTSATMADYFDTFVHDVKEHRRVLEETGDELQASGGIPTGFPSLDRMIHGWQRGSMVTIAAKTGIGKSTTAIDIALAAARSNASVLMFNMEMSVSDVVSKIVSCDTQVSTGRIKTGRVSDDDIRRIEAARNLTGMKIKLDTFQGATIDYIRAQSQKLAQSEAGLDMVIIDYLGLIKYRGRFSSDRQNQVAETSSQLKALAMQLDVPVIVMSQLTNRDRGEEADQEPTLAMIRESGAVANDSDVIILLHRPGTTRRGEPIPATKFIVAKNRMGDRGSFMCHSRLGISRFDEIPKDGDGDFDEDEAAKEDMIAGETGGSGPDTTRERKDSDPWMPKSTPVEDEEGHPVSTPVDETRQKEIDEIFGDESGFGGLDGLGGSDGGDGS